jgi:hypothetical protein
MNNLQTQIEIPQAQVVIDIPDDQQHNHCLKYSLAAGGSIILIGTMLTIAFTVILTPAPQSVPVSLPTSYEYDVYNIYSCNRALKITAGYVAPSIVICTLSDLARSWNITYKNTGTVSDTDYAETGQKLVNAIFPLYTLLNGGLSALTQCIDTNNSIGNICYNITTKQTCNFIKNHKEIYQRAFFENSTVELYSELSSLNLVNFTSEKNIFIINDYINNYPTSCGHSHPCIVGLLLSSVINTTCMESIT